MTVLVPVALLTLLAAHPPLSTEAERSGFVRTGRYGETVSLCGAFEKAYPMKEDILAEMETAVPRPVTPLYQNISTIVSSTLSPPSSINPDATAKELKSKIQDAIDGKGILP